MPTRILLDGALFSECEMMGSNRSGMLRLTEDITKNLVENKGLSISFANTNFTEQYDRALRKFVADNYPVLKNKILPRKPFFNSNTPGWRGRLKRLFDDVLLQLYNRDVVKYDVFHSFYYPFPEHIKSKKIKKSITYLDIIPLRIGGYPDALIDATKKVVESIVPNFAISISEFSRQDLIAYDKRIDPERVFVAPLAASKKLFFQDRSSNEWARVKNKYKLPDNYFLSISSKDHRKNIPHLLKSFTKFILQQNPKDLFLVLTGNFTYSYSILDELKLNKAVKDRIVITEKHIDDTDLSAIYSNALCFFFMSLYEGFGLPVLEAMQCGIPVITSNKSSIPEVVGDAGIMLSPNDEDGLCEVMNKMYSDKGLRDKYSELGLERAKHFSWQRCANEYVDIFKKITTSFD